MFSLLEKKGHDGGKGREKGGGAWISTKTETFEGKVTYLYLFYLLTFVNEYR